MVYESLAGEYVVEYPGFGAIGGITALTIAYLAIRHKQDITNIINKIKS
ncbi:MAG: hypothetical protein KAS90_02705 [Candidatus Aenigmarchaeota archaeon]|nr:hypothetical protein [Candidatus Aenigmarchaeota archaeon]